jgi:hypothetical protein
MRGGPRHSIEVADHYFRKLTLNPESPRSIEVSSQLLIQNDRVDLPSLKSVDAFGTGAGLHHTVTRRFQQQLASQQACQFIIDARIMAGSRTSKLLGLASHKALTTHTIAMRRWHSHGYVSNGLSNLACCPSKVKWCQNGSRSVRHSDTSIAPSVSLLLLNQLLGVSPRPLCLEWEVP